MSVQVEGLNLLLRNLRKLSTEYPKEMKKINEEVVKPVVRSAKSKVRNRSGRLRDSIKPSATQKAGRVQAGARLKYGGVNHYGWPGHNIEGNPFLTDAIREGERKIADDYEKLTAKFINKVWVDNF